MCPVHEKIQNCWRYAAEGRKSGMFKKLFGGVLLLMLLGVFAFGRETWSYLRTSVTHVRQAIKAEMPIEFELERARKMVEEILPDIRQCMHVIAEEEVNVEELTREIDRRTADLNGMKSSLLTQRESLETPGVITASAVSHTGAKRELAAKFARFKTLEETLGSKQQILEARRKALQSAREKLEAMLTTKQELQVQLEQLDARVKTLQAAEVANHVVIDDTQLNRAKTLILELNKNLDIKQRVLDAEGHLIASVDGPATNEAPADLLQQIDHHFGRETPPQLDVAATPAPQPEEDK